MATPTDLSVLLRMYAAKQRNPTIIIQDFCAYLQKYARHYLQNAPELSVYVENTADAVQKELERLESEEKVYLNSDLKSRKLVFVPWYYIDRMVQRYKDIDEHSEVPFPLANEIPQGFPPAYLKPVYITTDFTALDEQGERSNSRLLKLIFPDETPPLVYPGSISPEKMLDYALSKIRVLMRKDESRDFLMKRMMIANPGKELAIRNQITQFQTRPSESLSAIRHSGEVYHFWSYLCSFIRQDLGKKNEKTPEEIALLQSVYIIEYLNNYYKSKAQQDLQRQTALKNLELCFQKPPYCFDMEAITRFSDSRGIPLLGQYKNTDLESFIKERTESAGIDALPALLVIKTEGGKRYFVLKENIAPLAVKLCNESRRGIKEAITREWFKALCEYRQESAMKSQADFEKKIEATCRASAPVLHALLTASFIPLLGMEGSGQNPEAPNGFRMFSHGRLLPWSEILELNRQELLTDTRILLPFWYTLPIISSIVAFFRRPQQPKRKPEPARKSPSTPGRTDGGKGGTAPEEEQHTRRTELKNAALAIERALVPAGSTLEEETAAQLELWNRTLNPDLKANLTEDVNSLVRDYFRKIVKTLRASTFDRERIKGLAETLVDTPNLAKIKNREALVAYVELNILKLLHTLK